MYEVILVLLVFLFLIFSRLPIAFSIASISLLWIFIASDSVSRATVQLFSGLNAFVILAIPFFIFAGELMNQAGITEKLFQAANLTVGRLRGGLAQANIVASMMFAGLSGSAIADVAAIGAIFIPQMEREGYRSDFSAAVTAASSLVGPIIPPSILIVIYGALTNTSVGGLFAAATIPGILLGVSQISMVAVLSRRKDLPRHEVDIDRREIPSIIMYSILAMTMPAIIFFGIVGGVFTPTEAAAVACGYAIFIGVFVFRNLTFQTFYDSLKTTVDRTGQLLVIFGFGVVLSWTLAKRGFPELLAGVLTGMNLGPIGYMFIVMLLLLFVGTWMDAAAGLVILAPILSQVAGEIGIHPLQFGIVLVLTLNFGLITPPVGICLFTASSISGDTVGSISKQIVPLFLVNMIVLILSILIAPITLSLPRLLDLI